MKSWAMIAILSLPLTAEDTGSRWHTSGFGTLGLAFNSTNQAEYSRDPTQPIGVGRSLDPNLDSRLGLQLNLTLTNELSFVAQAVSKYRYDHTFTPQITWGFLSYMPTSGIQARAGRVGWDVFPLSDTRDVGYSYLWARPPVDFYGILQVSCLDGGDLSYTTPIGGDRNLRLKVSLGRASQNDTIPIRGGSNISLSGTRLFGSLAEFQGDALTVRLAYARANPIRNFPAPITDLQAGLDGYGLALQDPGLTQQADNLDFSANRFQFYSLGIEWQAGPLRVNSAVAEVRSGNGPIPNMKNGYVSVGYRLGAVVPYVLVSRLVTDHHAPYVGALPNLGPQGAALANGVAALMSNEGASQSTVTLGQRWDFHPKAALKAQVDRVMADAEYPLLWQNTKPGWSGNATVASITLDFVF
jgi:hypothetical protein